MFIDLIIGRRGCGKTALIIELAENYAAEGFPVYLVQSVKKLMPRHPRIRLCWTFESAVRRGWYHRPCVILVDEYMTFRHDPNFEWILLYGRNYEMALILDTQRPAMIDTDIRALGNRFYILQMTDSTDYDWLKKNFGKEYADTAKALPEHKYFIHPEEKKHEGQNKGSNNGDVYTGDRNVRPGGGEADQGAPGGPPGVRAADNEGAHGV